MPDPTHMMNMVDCMTIWAQKLGGIYSLTIYYRNYSLFIKINNLFSFKNYSNQEKRAVPINPWESNCKIAPLSPLLVTEPIPIIINPCEI